MKKRKVFVILLLVLWVLCPQAIFAENMVLGDVIERIDLSDYAGNDECFKRIEFQDSYGVGITVVKTSGEDNYENIDIFVDYDGNVYTGSVFRDGIAVAEQNGKFGYINENYEWVVAPIYDKAEPFSDGYGVVKYNDSYCIVNSAGSIMRFSESAIDRFYDGYSFIHEKQGDGSYTYYALDKDLNSVPVLIDGYRLFGRDTINKGHSVIGFKTSGDMCYAAVFNLWGEKQCEAEFPMGENSFVSICFLDENSAVIKVVNYIEADKSNNYYLSANKVVAKSDSEINFDYFAKQGICRYLNDYILTYDGCIYNNDLEFVKNVMPLGYDRLDLSDYKGTVAMIPTNGEQSAADELYLVTNKDKFQPGKVAAVDRTRIFQYTFKNISVFVNNMPIKFERDPFIENERTLVPMRRIFEELGAGVTWDNETQTAAAVRNGIEVKITIGSDVMYKNGEAIQLDAGARLIDDGYTFVPLRAVSEAFGCDVQWNEELQTVDIATK